MSDQQPQRPPGTAGRRDSVSSESTLASTLDHTLEFDWEASPYTFRGDGSISSARGRGSPLVLDLPLDDNLVTLGVANDGVDGEAPPAPVRYTAPDGNRSNVVFSQPPAAHTGDFHGTIFPSHVEGYGVESESESEEEDDVVLVENTSVRDERTLFGRAFSKATVPASQSISANKEDAANAAKAINNITKKPLGPIWHATTQIFFISIFFANLIVTIIDVAEDADPLRFNVPDLVLGVCENIALVTLWFIF